MKELMGSVQNYYEQTFCHDNHDHVKLLGSVNNILIFFILNFTDIIFIS
jgi:hypothetical protein